MKVIGYQFSDNKLINSLNKSVEVKDLHSVIQFMLDPIEFADDGENSKIMRVCWDLDIMIAPVVRMLGEEKARELHKKSKCRVEFGEQIVEAYEFWYGRRKGFSIHRLGTKQEGLIFHLKQFFPPETEEPQNLVELEAYVRLLIKSFKHIGFIPLNLYSPISVMKEYLRHMDIPNYKDIPREVSEYAIMCGGKQWNEAHQIGHFEKAWDYDLSSAYPNVLAQCLDIRLGTWAKTLTFREDAIYGYYRCKVKIDKDISPIIYRARTEESHDTSPTGEWDDWLNQSEIECIRKWKIGSVEIYNGWYWIPKEEKHPIAHVIYRLQRHKNKGDKLSSWIAKSMLVGLYGYQGYETPKKLGEFNNPVWFAECTCQTRCNLANFIYKHDVKPIAITVDGVLSENEIELGEEEKKSWRMSYSGEALVISTGVSYINSKKPLGLTLERVKDMVASNPMVSYWEARKTRIVTLGEAIEWDRLDLVGKENEFRISVDLNIDRDRYFKRTPKNGKELMSKVFKSRAYKIEELTV